jgi:hypothetical protein
MAAFGPRAINKFAPWQRIVAQQAAARITAALGYSTVILIGDSRMAALGSLSIEQQPEPQSRAFIFNLGLAGSTSQQWARHLETSWIGTPRTAIAVVWLGVNDMIHDGQSATPIAGHIRSIATHLQPNSRAVVLLDQIAFPMERAPQFKHLATESQAINAQIWSAPPTGIKRVRLDDMLTASAVFDGIHLTEAANDVVRYRVADVMTAIQTSRLTEAQ